MFIIIFQSSFVIFLWSRKSNVIINFIVCAPHTWIAGHWYWRM